MITAKVVADSINQYGSRITSIVVTLPRIILAEANTHRMLSRNSASSRAIPFKKMVRSVKENPFIPMAWQKDHSGMQGSVYLSKTERFGLSDFVGSLISTLNGLDSASKEFESLKKEVDEKVEMIETMLSPYKYESKTLDEWWLFARDKAVEAACIMYVFRVTKQLANRLLEPFMWHTVIITATEWENFFYLRCPKYSIYSEQIPMEFRSWKDLTAFVNKVEADEFKGYLDNNDIQERLECNKGQAEIHMMALAEAMWDAYNESTPKELVAGEWHMPFGDSMDDVDSSLADDDGRPCTKEEIDEFKVKIATARCARVSYTVIGEDSKAYNYANDITLHDTLAKSGHWSPFEHCARAMTKGEYDSSFCRGTGSGPDFYTDGWSGNLRGFTQYRKLFHNENIR